MSNAATELARRMASSLRKPVTVDEHALRLRAERGARAENLLRDDTFSEALAEIEAFYLDAWRRSTLEAVDLRERAHIAVSLIDDLKNAIVSRVRDGEVARETLKKSLRPSI
jgi:hypothetical protein